MSLDGAYDPQNVFAKIIRGEMPCVKVLEDDEVLALMDIFPESRGHVLVISKTSQARNLLDVEPEALQAIILATRRVARAVRKALDPEGVTIIQYNGAPAGQTVFHLHFHVIPKHAGQSLGRHASGAMADMNELNATAALITAALD
jgi:histidine triad (HIT) family protein